MPFDNRVVREIQARVDLLAYVSQYVTLRKRGREYVGLCPFHAEKTPSFSLNAEKGVWHCYGCDAGGDLITFVRRYENMDLNDAVRLLAARAGVEMRESEGTRRRRSEREAIYEANAVAKGYFMESLQHTKEARDYVARRGLNDETCQTFGVGFAPDSWDGLVTALGRAHIDLQLALRAGLISTRQNERGYIDFFRRRLMFPVFNLTAEVIAFGGRTLGDEQPKYLNTRNTAVYTKGHHMYGLHVARRAAAAHEALIVVEGYLDCLALHQAGFANAVASLGTAFTVEQARELRRVASNLYLCFDGDAAGQAATARSIDMLVDEGLVVRVVRLPKGRDPDSIVLEDGRDAFAALLEQSQGWVDFKIELACARISGAFSRKADVAREAMAVIGQVRDPIERDQYVKTMARKLDVSEAALRSMRTLSSSVVVAQKNTSGAESPHRRGPGPVAALSVERELVALILVKPAFIDAVAPRISAEDFTDEDMARAYTALVRQRADLGRGINPLTLVADDPNIADLTHLALSSPPLDAEDEEQRLERLLDRFERQRLERRLWSIDAEMNRLLNQGASVPDALRDEYNSLAATLRGATIERKGAK
ncbi:MAG: DNA primase [Candidatus Eremiobacteraeota bacterium]|nr:DNA primase [Candidatus Eremiobacteraeota bacterium]